MRRRPVAGMAVLGMAVLGLLGAGIGAADESDAAASRPTGSITVFAASSLTEVFTRLGREFERRHSGTTVTLNFNASSALATQISEGAPADVFASADTETMQGLIEDRAVAGRPVVFARNRLEIAVEPGNPLRIRSLADTRREGVTLVLCAPVVPCGAYARASYARAGVRVGTVPTAESAKAAITRVVLGEADAAVVYATDVKAAGRDVSGVSIPDRDNVVASYPVGVVREGSNHRLARAFVDEVISDRGQRILRRHGFGAP